MLKIALLRTLCGVTLTAFALAVPAVSQAQSGYSIIDLGTLGGRASVGYGINANGDVTGFSETPGTTDFNAFRYANGALQNLGNLGGASSAGQGINDSGQVVGSSYTANNGGTHALLVTGANLKDLGTLGGGTSFAFGVNNSGQIVGYSSTMGETANHAVLWIGAMMTDLGTLGGTSSIGYGINASGQVTGESNIAGDSESHAIRYANGVMQDLGTLGGTRSVGEGINASGQVAGYSYIAGNAAFHAVLWTGATMTDLGGLGGANSYAYGINASGDVVGISDTTGKLGAAFLYRNGRMTDLNTLLPSGSGWNLYFAFGINDSGLITGEGRINGANHAYILRPNAVTASGRIALEGVADLSAVSPAAPLGTFHLSFRTPGTTTEVSSADVTLTPTAGSPFGAFTLSNPPLGSYDLAIKGGKNLRIVLPSVTITATAALPAVTLPAGDANNDNTVDPGAFGVLVDAYGGDSSVPGSGYDPTADFNFDGAVDATDFGLLVGNYGKIGDP